MKELINQLKIQGGLIKGKGTATSDSIATDLPVGNAIIPASVVKMLGKDFFDKLVASVSDKEANEQGMIPAKISNGEYSIPKRVIDHYGPKFINSLIHTKPVDTKEEIGEMKLGRVHARSGATELTPEGAQVMDDRYAQVKAERAAERLAKAPSTPIAPNPVVNTANGINAESLSSQPAAAQPQQSFTDKMAGNTGYTPKATPDVTFSNKLSQSTGYNPNLSLTNKITGVTAKPVELQGTGKLIKSAVTNNMGRLGGSALAIVPEAYNTVKDINTQGMDSTDKAARIAEGLGRTASTLAGGEIGAGLGTLVTPGIGTLIGGALGGGIGYLAPEATQAFYSKMTGNDVQLPSQKAQQIQRLVTGQQNRPAQDNKYALNTNYPNAENKILNSKLGVDKTTDAITPAFLTPIASKNNEDIASSEVTKPKTVLNAEGKEVPIASATQSLTPYLVPGKLGARTNLGNASTLSLSNGQGGSGTVQINPNGQGGIGRGSSAFGAQGLGETANGEPISYIKGQPVYMKTGAPVDPRDIQSRVGPKGGSGFSDESMARINREMSLNADPAFQKRLAKEAATVNDRYANAKLGREADYVKSIENQAMYGEGKNKRDSAVRVLQNRSVIDNARAAQQFNSNLQLNKLAYDRQKDQAANESALENMSYERNTPMIKEFKVIGPDESETTEYGAVNKKTGQRIIQAPQGAIDSLTNAKGTKEYEILKNQFLQKYGQLPEGI